MATGLSRPIGFQNGTDGSLQIALDAMQSARTPHNFLGIDQDGITSIIRTTGNPAGHIVLRGGRSRPTYDSESIRETEDTMVQAGRPPVRMGETSHTAPGQEQSLPEEHRPRASAQRTTGTRSAPPATSA